MKFSDLFEEVEDWFWKLEFNPETGIYELYLGIPNDWIYSGNGKDISIDLIHQMDSNSIIKISGLSDEVTVDDIILTAKLLVGKNKELEKKKEEHRLEMERLKDMLIEKEKNFLTYIDTVKDTKGTGIAEEEEENDGENDGVSGETSEGISLEEADNFMRDMGKTS